MDSWWIRQMIPNKFKLLYLISNFTVSSLLVGSLLWGVPLVNVTLPGMRRARIELQILLESSIIETLVR